MLAPFAAGYFLSYMFRAINAVVAPNLASELDLDAGQLGLVTAAYLIAFALFQLPLGMLLDRYGPRRVQTVLLTTAAIGATAFAMAESALGLALARALIGLGFAGGLMAGFKAVVIWFAPARHALANASIMSVGGLGMLAATLPAEYAVQTIGWRGLFYVSAGVTAAVAIGIYFIVPEREAERRTSSIKQQLADIKLIYSDPFFWRIAPLVALTSGAHVGIHTLWAGPWFRDIGGLDRDGVALYLLVIAVAFLVGTLGAGFVADRLGRRGVDAIHIMIVGLGLFMLSQVAIIAELTILNPLMWTVFRDDGTARYAGVSQVGSTFWCGAFRTRTDEHEPTAIRDGLLLTVGHWRHFGPLPAICEPIRCRGLSECFRGAASGSSVGVGLVLCIKSEAPGRELARPFSLVSWTLHER